MHVCVNESAKDDRVYSNATRIDSFGQMRRALLNRNVLEKVPALFFELELLDVVRNKFLF